MLRYIFKNTNIIIHVYYLDRPEVLTEEEKLQIIKDFHDTPLGGHQGITRTYKRIRLKYNWKNIKLDIQDYINKCEKCQKNKSARIRTKVPMEITTTSSDPFEKCFLDIVGPLPETENGNKYILTFQDDLTKFSEAIPIENQEAETVADKFVRDIICRHGIPFSILTDQGSNFMSEVFKNVCKFLRIKKLNTTAYRPQSNGALERSHHTLVEYLKAFTNQDQTNWDQWIQYSTFTYNTTPHTSTGYTPFELVYGFQARLPSSIQSMPNLNYSYDDYLKDLKLKLQISHSVAKDKLIHKKHISKNYYDRNVKDIKFQIGDKVLLYDETVRRGRSKKLDASWIGPYEIITQDSPVNYTIMKNKKYYKTHVNRLKYFID